MDWPDEFVAYIMGIAGLSWKRVPAGASRDTILQMLSDSLMLGFPALIRLDNGVDWTVVLGCEDNGLLLTPTRLSNRMELSEGWIFS